MLVLPTIRSSYLKSTASKGTTDVGESNHELTYMVAFEDANQRMAAWDSFRNDPEWAKVTVDSHRDGLIVKNVRNQLLTPTDYSPMQ